MSARPRTSGVSSSVDPSTKGLSFSESNWHSIAESLSMSNRELDVVRNLFQGGTEAVIAAQLGLSIHTVHSHIDRIYRKLGVNTRSALLVRIFNEYLSLAERDVFRTRHQPRRGPRRHLITTKSCSNRSQ